MARPELTALAMEAQVVLRDTRRRMAPLYQLALASGNAAAISEAKAIADTLRASETQAKRLTGIADGLIRCEDGLFGPSHGRAA